MLGLGNIGPLAGKPVMEGKAVLFKKFAGIDVFDIEIEAHEVDHVVEVVAALEPTFGGINLEDIKAPECFDIEDEAQGAHEDPGLPRRPAWHRHHRRRPRCRTRLHLTGKRIGDGQDRRLRARARRRSPASTCWSRSAPKRENIWVTDIEGVVYEGRPTLMDRWKAVYAQETDKRTLGEVIDGADIFLGLSAAGVLKPEMVKRMARASADHGARQSDARDHAGGGARGAARRA